LTTTEFGFDFWQRQEIFLLSYATRLSIGPTQPRIQYILRAASPRSKAAG